MLPKPFLFLAPSATQKTQSDLGIVGRIFRKDRVTETRDPSTANIVYFARATYSARDDKVWVELRTLVLILVLIADLMYSFSMLRRLSTALAPVPLFVFVFVFILVLVFASSMPTGAQNQIPATAKSETKPNMAQNQTPATSKAETKSQGRIVGIGGIFFKTPDKAKTREWYATHLGLVDKGSGAMLPWREHDDPEKEHVTVWSAFPSSTDYFAPGQALMIDYIVDDLDAMLERLQKEGVKIDPQRMNESYGRFAWIYDSDGNKIELWEPQAKPKP